MWLISLILLKIDYNCTYYYNSYMWLICSKLVQFFKISIRPIYDKERSIAHCVCMCNNHYKFNLILWRNEFAKYSDGEYRRHRTSSRMIEILCSPENTMRRQWKQKYSIGKMSCQLLKTKTTNFRWWSHFTIGAELCWV